MLHYIKCSLMKTAYGTVQRPRAFGVKGYAVASFHKIAEFGHYRVHPGRSGEKFGLMYGVTVERILPDPVGGEDYEFWGAGEQRHQVQVGGMVADDYSRLAEVLSRRVFLSEFHSRNLVGVEQEARHEVQSPVQIEFLLLPVLCKSHIEKCNRGHKAEGVDAEKEQGVESPQKGHQSPEKHSRITPDHRQKAQNRVQHCNPQKIRPRPEMSNPLTCRRIVHVHRDAHQFHSRPGGKDHKFQFGLVAGGRKG